MYKSKRSRATDIPRSVKKKVWERDNHRCIICKNPNSMPNAHFIPRAHGGLGIEQNIVTLCQNCHHKTDQTSERKLYLGFIEKYLQEKYRGWREENLIYKK